MNLEKTPGEGPAPQAGAEGCLVVAIRIPVRIVVLVLVVPVRMVWDALVVGGRFLRDHALRPVGWALAWVAWAVCVWPFVTAWRYAVVPVGKGLGRLGYVLGHVLVVAPLMWLYRTVLTPVGHAVAMALLATGAGLGWVFRGIGAGLGWVYVRVLTPVGHVIARLGRGIGAVLAAVGIGAYATVAWLVRYLLVVPGKWLYERVLAPVGRGVAWVVQGLAWIVRMIFAGIGVAGYWILRVLLVLPALAVWRWVLVPVGRLLAVVGREVGAALGHAWRVAGYLSLAVGRFLGRLFRWIFVEPVRWAYRTVLTPVGHVVRDAVLRPAAEAARGVRRVTRQALAAARDSARQARADFRRMVFGSPREPLPVPREPAPAVLASSRREPGADETRTLDSSRTALTKD
ncbi:hypothetical protein [Streptomyces sp. NPDC050535]|uniref:hypothetical protein n=1 Tax=Streptomyces sp. NPDC050535 TaxID=3365626 RepID=UPI0037AA71C9